MFTRLGQIQIWHQCGAWASQQKVQLGDCGPWRVFKVNSLLLKGPRQCVSWWGWVSGSQSPSVHQVNVDSDLAACGERSVWGNGGSSTCLEAKFCFSLYVSGIHFSPYPPVAVPLRKPSVDACEQGSLCAGPLRGHLSFQRPSFSSGWMNPC